MSRAATPIVRPSAKWALQPTPQSFAGNVLTQPFAQGVLLPPGNNLAITGLFYIEAFPLGSVTLGDITITYAGLPCQVAICPNNAAGTASDERLLVAAVCLPDVTDVFTGSDFVVTIGGSPSFLQHYGMIASVSIDVDPSFNLSTAIQQNAGQTLDPAQWTLLMPALAGNAGDMLVSGVSVSRGGWGLDTTVQSPSGWVSDAFAIGGGLPLSLAYHELSGTVSETALWGVPSPHTINAPDGIALEWTFPAGPDYPCDPHFAEVVLLLTFDGPDLSTTVLDSSNFAHPMTVSGIAAISGSQLLWGVGSFNLPSTGTADHSYVATPIAASSPLDILSDASVDFTIEGWFYLTPTNTANLVIVDYGDDLVSFGGTSGIKLVASSVTGGNFQVQPTIPSWSGLGGAVALSTSAWHHFAITRQGANGHLWLDGVEQGVHSSNWNGYAGPPAGSSATFGWSATIAGGLDPGFIDEIRVTKGLARYTSNFTPPDQPFGESCIIAVPDVIGDTLATATSTITGAGFVLGNVSNLYNASVPVGIVFQQSPGAGALGLPGDPVNITLSLGAQFAVVPDVVGLTATDARAALTAAGLTAGAVTGVVDIEIPIGSVATQGIPFGTHVPFGTAVDLGVSFLVTEFDIDVTVISQYANSPTILALVEDFGQWFDPAANIQDFYLQVWNIETASGFGLDIWGLILGVSRVIPIPGSSGAFGFDNTDTPKDWQNFGNLTLPTAGGPFFSGEISTGSYRLSDGPYLTLLLTKALANVCATTAPALNRLITNLFPGRGRCYTQDLGGMEMAYHFNFTLTTIELAILEFSGVLAHPAGVGVTINIVPEELFGFQEAGALSKPFNFGAFYNGA